MIESNNWAAKSLYSTNPFTYNFGLVATRYLFLTIPLLILLLVLSLQ